MKLCIDAGHGGRWPGTGSVGGIKEANVALAYARSCADHALRLGLQVVLTRTADVALGPTLGQDLRERCRIANDAGADVFLSLHCNAGPSSARGFQAIHAAPSRRGREVAERIERAVHSRWPRGPRAGVFPDASLHVGYTTRAAQYHATLSPRLVWRERDRLVRERFGEDTYRTLAVLRGTRMPAVIVELGYLTNEWERGRLLDPVVREEMAERIVRAAAGLHVETSSRIG